MCIDLSDCFGCVVQFVLFLDVLATQAPNMHEMKCQGPSESFSFVRPLALQKRQKMKIDEIVKTAFCFVLFGFVWFGFL